MSTGFDILDNIDYSDIHIVICTAHDEFALKAIQYEVVDYLMKPMKSKIYKTPLIKSEKDRKNEKPLYDSSAISKFTIPIQILINQFWLKIKIRLILYVQKTSYLLRRHTQKVESQLWLFEMDVLNLAQLS